MAALSLCMQWLGLTNLGNQWSAHQFGVLDERLRRLINFLIRVVKIIFVPVQDYRTDRSLQARHRQRGEREIDAYGEKSLARRESLIWMRGKHEKHNGHGKCGSSDIYGLQ